jgi:hypothetical protein
VGVAVNEAEEVGVGVELFVGVPVDVHVYDAEAVSVGVALLVGEAVVVPVNVGEQVGVEVMVRVGVMVGVVVRVALIVQVAVGVPLISFTLAANSEVLLAPSVASAVTNSPAARPGFGTFQAPPESAVVQPTSCKLPPL